MSIIETDTIKHTKDMIADTISSGIDALPFDPTDIDLPDVSDVSDSITNAASVVATKGGRGVTRVYRTASRTVRRHPKGVAGLVVAALLAAGFVMWWTRRETPAEQESLRVASAA